MKPKLTRMLATMATATFTVTALLSTATTATAQEAPAKVTSLTIGDSVPALEGVTWLQGEPITTLNEPGKVYMFELWATWCGPCVTIIPHINELHKKYADKGLVVVGMNIWEDDIKVPTEFFKNQGDAMSYRVAYSGGSKGSFSKTWLTPSGIKSIPHALIVKDGKIIYKGHPASLDNSAIERMLDGSYDPIAEAKKAEVEAKAQQELRSKIMPLIQSGDWDGILELANTLEDSNPTKLKLTITAITQKGDWKALSHQRAKLAANKNPLLPVTKIDQTVALRMRAGDGAKEYAQTALASFTPADAKASVREQIHLNVIESRLNFLAGNTEVAKSKIAAIHPLMEKVKDERFKKQFTMLLPAIEKALSEGSFPSLPELYKAGQKKK